MENRNTITNTANSSISYDQIYEYATTQDVSIKKNLLSIIENASEENAKKNLEVISSYTHIYCAPYNNPIKQIASETYEWASDYSSKGLHLIADGFHESGGQQSFLGAIAGFTLFGTGGLVLGGIAGTAHAIYSLSNGMTLNDDQKNVALDLQRIAQQRVNNVNLISNSSDQQVTESIERTKESPTVSKKESSKENKENQLESFNQNETKKKDTLKNNHNKRKHIISDIFQPTSPPIRPTQPNELEQKRTLSLPQLKRPRMN